jgi:hypothetical protein
VPGSPIRNRAKNKPGARGARLSRARASYVCARTYARALHARVYTRACAAFNWILWICRGLNPGTGSGTLWYGLHRGSCRYGEKSEGVSDPHPHRPLRIRPRGGRRVELMPVHCLTRPFIRNRSCMWSTRRERSDVYGESYDIVVSMVRRGLARAHPCRWLEDAPGRLMPCSCPAHGVWLCGARGVLCCARSGALYARSGARPARPARSASRPARSASHLTASPRLSPSGLAPTLCRVPNSIVGGSVGCADPTPHYLMKCDRNVVAK